MNPKIHQWLKFNQFFSTMMLNCREKNEIKRSSHSGHTLSKRIRENFAAKFRNHTVKLLKITKSLGCSYGCLPIIVSWLSSSYLTLVNAFGIAKYAYIVIVIDVFMYAYLHAKNQIHTLVHFWDCFQFKYIVFNHSGHEWPHTLETIEQICNFYGPLAISKKSILEIKLTHCLA